MAINKVDAFFIRVNANNAENWSKNFIGIDTHIRFHIIEKSGAEPETICCAIDLRVAPIDDDCCAFLDASFDITCHFVAMYASYERPHI